MSRLNTDTLEYLKQLKPPTEPILYRPEYMGTTEGKNYIPLYVPEGDLYFGIPEFDKSIVLPRINNSTIYELFHSYKFSTFKDEGLEEKWLIGYGCVFLLIGRVAHLVVVSVKNKNSDDIRLIINNSFQSGRIPRVTPSCRYRLDSITVAIVNYCIAYGVCGYISNDVMNVYFPRVADNKVVFDSVLDRIEYEKNIVNEVIRESLNPSEQTHIFTSMQRVQVEQVQNEE